MKNYWRWLEDNNTRRPFRSRLGEANGSLRGSTHVNALEALSLLVCTTENRKKTLSISLHPRALERNRGGKDSGARWRWADVLRPPLPPFFLLSSLSPFFLFYPSAPRHPSFSARARLSQESSARSSRQIASSRGEREPTVESDYIVNTEEATLPCLE